MRHMIAPSAAKKTPRLARATLAAFSALKVSAPPFKKKMRNTNVKRRTPDPLRE